MKVWRLQVNNSLLPLLTIKLLMSYVKRPRATLVVLKNERYADSQNIGPLLILTFKNGSTDEPRCFQNSSR